MCRCRSACRFMLTRPPSPAFGMCRWRMSTRAGAMRAPWTAPRQASSRKLVRCTAAGAGGRHADYAWLLELPRPFTRLSGDNAALIAPDTVARLGLATEDIVTIEAGGRSLRAPVFVLPGQAGECITLPLGFGRPAGGLSVGVGFDAYPLRLADAPWLETAAAV